MTGETFVATATELQHVVEYGECAEASVSLTVVGARSTRADAEVALSAWVLHNVDSSASDVELAITQLNASGQPVGTAKYQLAMTIKPMEDPS